MVKLIGYQIGLPYNIRHKIWTGCEKQGRHHKPVLISSSGFKEEIIRLAFLICRIEGFYICATDVGNAYLVRHAEEKETWTMDQS
jgi:hypothetical protein